MKYEDLKDSFKFKTQEGKSDLTYTADKKSKHIWTVSTECSHNTNGWDCEDMLTHFNSGSWVIQDEDQLEETHEVQEQLEETHEVQEQLEETHEVQEQAQEVPEVKTLRDELIIAVLPTVCKAFFSKNYAPDSWTKYIADDTIAIVDSVLKARKESL